MILAMLLLRSPTPHARQPAVVANIGPAAYWCKRSLNPTYAADITEKNALLTLLICLTWELEVAYTASHDARTHCRRWRPSLCSSGGQVRGTATQWTSYP